MFGGRLLKEDRKKREVPGNTGLPRLRRLLQRQWEMGSIQVTVGCVWRMLFCAFRPGEKSGRVRSKLLRVAGEGGSLESERGSEGFSTFTLFI